MNQRDKLDLVALRLKVARAEQEIREAAKLAHLAAVVFDQSGMVANASMAREMVARLRLLADELEQDGAAADD